MASATKHRVLFAQRRLPAYRMPFLELARSALQQRGIELVFSHGDPSPAERLKRDEGHLAWAQRLPLTRYFFGKLCWQPFSTRGYDMVIVSQENSLLFNHWLCRPWRQFKLGFFGHGANLAAGNANSLRERFKRFTTRQADWWFAYTSVSAALLLRAGFAASRTTVFNNAVDTQSLRRQVADISPTQRQSMVEKLGLAPGKTGLFIGSLYEGKGLALLLAAAEHCASTDPQFKLIVVGDGAAAGTVLHAARQFSWLHWAGAQHGDAKALYLAVADFMLMPASVGLAILDGFAVGLPIITTSAIGHGPEIAYLEPGLNGKLTEPNPCAFGAAIQQLLNDPAELLVLRQGALSSGLKYTVQAMAQNFAKGIEQAIKTSARGHETA